MIKEIMLSPKISLTIEQNLTLILTSGEKFERLNENMTIEVSS